MHKQVPPALCVRREGDGPARSLPPTQTGGLLPVGLLPSVRPQVSCEICRSGEDLATVPGRDGEYTIRQRLGRRPACPHVSCSPRWASKARGPPPGGRRCPGILHLNLSFSPRAQVSFTEKRTGRTYCSPLGTMPPPQIASQPQSQLGLLWTGLSGWTATWPVPSPNRAFRHL